MAAEPKSRAPKRARKPAPEAAAPQPLQEPVRPTFAPNGVTLRSSTGGSAFIPFSAVFQEAAMRWTHIVERRARWSHRALLREEQANDCRKLLTSLGVSEELLRGAGVLEVIVPWTKESEGWEGRVFPWEYVLSAARGREESLPWVVERSLLRATPHPVAQGHTALLVHSAPPRARQYFAFEDEVAHVEKLLRKADWSSISKLRDPSPEQLREAILAQQPGLVYLTGMDTHEAFSYGDIDEFPAPLRDGMVFKNEESASSNSPSFKAIGAQDLASLLTGGGLAGSAPPRLVIFSVYNSAARIASLTVAMGAAHAVGFQDRFPDDLGEIFLSGFLNRWLTASTHPTEMFLDAWRSFRGTSNSLHGTGVVLWSGGAPPPAAPSVEPIRVTTPLTCEESGALAANELIEVAFKPVESINYAVLHNKQQLFEQLRVRRLHTQPLRDLRLEVVLHSGDQAFPFRHTFHLNEESVELKDAVCVPLTSPLNRTAHETIRSAISIEIAWGTRILHWQTQAVSWLPVDEWRDDVRGGGREVLASFVLPRDSAVPKIVDAAQRSLRFIRDDSMAGFEGYQGIREDKEDKYSSVDEQVWALWATLSFDTALSYVNPPPSYETKSQRLRTPSEVVRTGSGTCIDLALLFAACLEYVDIYPVIFVYTNHAFVGYWRTGQVDHDRYVRGQPRSTTDVPPSRHGEVASLALSGQVVPLETVELTRGGSFRKAGQLGFDNLKSAVGFEDMIDVCEKRLNGVLPLPILERGTE